MRRLAILSTVAALTMFSVANAEDTPTQNATLSETTATEAAAAPITEDALSAAVTAYAAFQTDITDLRGTRINSSADLEGALETATRHNRDALTRGWIAYGAYTAGQSQAFVQGVRDAAAYYGRDSILEAIVADNRYARALRGGDDATRIVLESAQADSARVIDVADRYQEMAYGLQRQRWANAVAPGQSARVQHVRDNNAAGSAEVPLADELTAQLAPALLSLSPEQTPTAFGGRRFWDGPAPAGVVQVSSEAPHAWRANPTRAEAIDRMTTIAAIQALGAAEERSAVIETTLADPRSRDCIEISQLQLYQCMSAARFRYENAFCLGQHALRDIGTCIANVGQPAPASTALINQPAPSGSAPVSAQ